MSVTVEDFLEHHGVKGQHWGIRNVKQEVHNFKTSFNRHKKLKIGLEIAGGVTAAAAIATGAIIADRLLKQHSAMKATDLTKLWSKGKPWLVPPISSSVMKTPVSSLSSASKGSHAIDIKGLMALKGRFEKHLKAPQKNNES